MGEGSVFEQLSALRQEGAVEDYIQSFEGLVAQVPKMPDEQYMGYFIHGLKEGIKGRVRSLKAIGPISRPRLMNLAMAMEMELQEKRSSWSGSRFSGPRGTGGWTRSSGIAGSGPHSSGRSQGGDWVMVWGGRENPDRSGPVSGPRSESKNEKRQFGPRERGIRHLSYQQLMERREKGLCFKCGGPWHPRHQCPDRQLRIMMLEEEDVEEGEVNVMSAEEEENEGDGELSAMSLNGLSDSKTSDVRTMKLKRKVHGVPILLLVDSGATQFHLPEISESYGVACGGDNFLADQIGGWVQNQHPRRMQRGVGRNW